MDKFIMILIIKLAKTAEEIKNVLDSIHELEITATRS